MRRAAVSFAFAACWVLCSLAPAGAQSAKERTSTTARISPSRRRPEGLRHGSERPLRPGRTHRGSIIREDRGHGLRGPSAPPELWRRASRRAVLSQHAAGRRRQPTRCRAQHHRQDDAQHGRPSLLRRRRDVLLGAAAMAGRSVLRRWWPGPFRRRGRPRVALRDCRGKAYLDASGRAEGVDRRGVPRCTRMR